MCNLITHFICFTGGTVCPVPGTAKEENQKHKRKEHETKTQESIGGCIHPLRRELVSGKFQLGRALLFPSTLSQMLSDMKPDLSFEINSEDAISMPFSTHFSNILR